MKIRKSMIFLGFMAICAIIALYGMATDNWDFELFGMYGVLVGWVESLMERIEKLEKRDADGN